MNHIIYDGKNINLGRIHGGIGWPSESPGFACVVGEELHPMLGSKVHRLFVSDETESKSTNQLLTECAKFVGVHNVSEFFSRYDESFFRTLAVWNDQHRQFRQLDIYSAPNSKAGLIGYHLECIESRLHKDQRTLFFHDPESKLSRYLDETPTGVINTATDVQFPAVAALGYCVAYLTECPPDLDDDDEDEYVPRKVISQVTGY
jgi:hypothetical protein